MKILQQPPIFPILGYDKFRDSYCNVGTAFFINDKGWFVTAAHTLANASQQYFAWLDKGGYPIKLAFFEYTDMEEQKAPTHRDLCISRIPGLSTPDFVRFKPSETLVPGDRLELSGFASREYLDIIIRQGVTEASQLFDDEPNDEDEQMEETYFQDFIFKETTDEPDPDALQLPGTENLRYSEITATYKHQDFERLHAELNVPGLFTNGFTIELTTRNLEPKGLSGCPVMHDGSATGMFIAARGAIKCEYILEKLKEIHV